MILRVCATCCVLLCGSVPARAQSTEVMLGGRVTHLRTNEGIGNAVVGYRNLATNVSGFAETDSHGYYSLPSLPPGVYTIRVEAPGFQAREIQARELYVAARLELNFDLRPLTEVFETGDNRSSRLPDNSAILPVLGPDLDIGRNAPLQPTDAQSEVRQPSLSYVIDPRQISQAPLSSRNVYSLLLTLPGVTASQVTGRGLQISAAGQRASASNYLLDGIQNNDFVNTGPFSATAPEAIQEYRVSTSNYSAEYGQTGGFVANAVSIRGGGDYHGVAYAYLDNDILSANSFLNNAFFLPRNAFKRLYTGYSAGGPIVRNRLFFSSAFERLRSRSRRSPQIVELITADRLRACAPGQSNPVLDLYDRFPLVDASLASSISLTADPCQALGISLMRPPVSIDRSIALERVDYDSPDGRNRVMARLAISRASQPDYIYSIYQGLSQSIVRNTTGLAAHYVRTIRPNLVNDLTAGWNSGRIDDTRPHPELPILQFYPPIPDVNNPNAPLATPSAGSPLDFGMKGNQWEINEGVTWSRQRHLITAGGAVLLRRPRYFLSYLNQGLYYFGAYTLFSFLSPPESFRNLAQGKPLYYELPVSRIDDLQGRTVPLAPAGYDSYSNNQFSAYFQDNVRLTPRLVVNLGVRYESYGALKNTSRAQTFVEPGPGDFIQDRIAAATLISESRATYRADRNNWAGRFGIAFNPRSGTVLRAGYGGFYDRPFDNLFLDARNEGVVKAFALNQAIDLNVTPRELFQKGFNKTTDPANGGIAYNSYYQQFQTLDSRLAHTNPIELLWIDRNLRTPYVHSWFASVQQQITTAWQVEVNHSGTLGRKLISNDLVNRVCSRLCNQNEGRLNSKLGDILYRSNSGDSDYMSLEALARYRTSRVLFQMAYTFSHSIDNISDPMLSDVFNLAATNPDTIGAAHGFGTFTRQFDSRADRGNSDFDIRHNLVFYSIWNIPGVTRTTWLHRITGGWAFAETAVIRSGLPYTVYSTSAPIANGVPLLVGARRDVRDLQALYRSFPVKGGEAVVNVNAGTSTPAAGQIGTLGRNALPGPGFWNVDVSLSKSFTIPKLGEAGRLQLGAAAFNAFNHSNLGFPDIFNGAAGYGPNENQVEFPAALPLFPTPRRIQLQLRVLF